jgi:putative PIN family toxin of toxin-antitoxin system
MGQEKIRIVLDTNVLVSALLFTGPTIRLVSLWREGRVVLLLSKDILVEYLRVLSYPKFALSPEDIKGLIEEIVLPFSETVKVRDRTPVIHQDPADDKFIFLALDGRADFIISGDRHLLSLGKYKSIKILTAREFLELPNVA